MTISSLILIFSSHQPINLSTYNLSAIQFPIQISSALNSIHLLHDVKTLSLYLLLSTSFFLTLSFYTSYFRIQYQSFVFSLKRQRSYHRHNRDIPATETSWPILYLLSLRSLFLISEASKVKKSTPKNHYLSTQSHKYRKEKEEYTPITYSYVYTG